MTYKKVVKGGCLILLALAVLAVAGVWMWKPWVPPLVVAEPGPSGSRVKIGKNPANYFPANGPGRRAAFLVLGGSEGGLGNGSARDARSLQEAGFTALQLSYFRAPGQSEDIVGIPLETFDAAIDWLKSQPNVDPARIGILGASKGAEAALVMAARRPDVRVVVAGMPSSVVWPGFSWNGNFVSGSTWTFKGRDITALPYGKGNVFADVGTFYRNGLAALPKRPETAIPIERSKAQFLLVCGEADSLWPSCPMARQLKLRAPQQVTILSYEDAGHGVFGSPTSVAPDSGGQGKATAPARLGGTIGGNRRARADSWPKVIHFIGAHLNS